MLHVQKNKSIIKIWILRKKRQLILVNDDRKKLCLRIFYKKVRGMYRSTFFISYVERREKEAFVEQG